MNTHLLEVKKPELGSTRSSYTDGTDKKYVKNNNAEISKEGYDITPKSGQA